MKIKSLSVAISAFLISCTTAVAQEANVKPYAYGHSLDFMYGDNFSPYKIDRAVNSAKGHAVGGNFDIRYTTYVLPWVGAYVQLGVARAKESATGYLGTFNDADNGLYSYKAYKIGSYNPGKGKMINTGFGPYVLLGAAFRYDISRFSIKPRIGIGNGKYLSRQYAYERLVKDGYSEAPTVYYYSMYNDPCEYIIDSKREEAKTKSATIMATSLQVSYTFNDHFYFSVEGGLKYSPTRIKILERVYTAKTDYDPQNWAQAVYDSSKRGDWEFDKNDYEESTRTQRIGGSSYIQFGIGWNFGRRHAENSWQNFKSSWLNFRTK